MANFGAKLLQNIKGTQKEVLYDIFVCIHKVYDVLHLGRALEIMEGCGVSPQVFQLLNRYWYRATMVVKVSG